MSQLPAQPNQSVIAAFECLHAIAMARSPVGSRELARQLGEDSTRVNRHLKTLSHLGLLHRTPDRKYRPGPAIHVLAALSFQGSHLLPAAMPHARKWWEDGYRLTLGVLWKTHICYLLHVAPDRPFETAVGGHEIMWAPWSSAGLALLAAQTPERVSQMTFPQWDRLVEPVSRLAKQLADVRKNGFAVRHYTDGVISVGVPIGSPPIAAFSVSRPGLKEREIPALVRKLKETASDIEGAM